MLLTGPGAFLRHLPRALAGCLFCLSAWAPFARLSLLQARVLSAASFVEAARAREAAEGAGDALTARWVDALRARLAADPAAALYPAVVALAAALVRDLAARGRLPVVT